MSCSATILRKPTIKQSKQKGRSAVPISHYIKLLSLAAVKGKNVLETICWSWPGRVVSRAKYGRLSGGTHGSGIAHGWLDVDRYSPALFAYMYRMSRPGCTSSSVGHRLGLVYCLLSRLSSRSAHSCSIAVGPEVKTGLPEGTGARPLRRKGYPLITSLLARAFSKRIETLGRAVHPQMSLQTLRH